MFVVRWKPNRKSESYEADKENMPNPNVIAVTDTLKKALRHGDNWATIHFPAEIVK